jgi:hypothetical protein
MHRHVTRTLLLAACLLLVACGSPTPIPPTSTTAPTAIPPSPAPTADPFFASTGGGEPRTAGYWLIWNACAEDNKADVAAANGGREAGWIILDDLLEDPGIWLGDLAVETCEQGVASLRGQDTSGMEKPDDAAYKLAAGLVVAQLNLAVGAEYCPAVDQAVRAGQLLLVSLSFDGAGDYLGPDQAPEDREVALFLVEQLGLYNAGQLCR